MALIKKKIWPDYFDLIASGRKKYDLRLNDFEAAAGDTLVFEEWDPATKAYTGRTLEKKITYAGKFSLADLQKWWPENEILEKGIQVFSLE